MSDNDRDDEYIHIPRGDQMEGQCPVCGEDTVIEFTDYELGTYNMEVVECCKHFIDYEGDGKFTWKESEEG